MWAGRRWYIFLAGMDNPFDVIVMALGGGAKAGSRRPKPLRQILGLPVLEYVLRTVESLSPREIVVAVDREAAGVKEAFAGRGLTFVDVDDGTGCAILGVREAVHAPYLLILPADLPLLRPQALERLHGEHRAHGASLSFLTACPDPPGDRPRVVRDEAGRPREIVELDDAPPEIRAVREVSPGIFCMDNTPELWDALREVPDPAKLVPHLYPRVHAVRWPEPEDLFRADTLRDLARAEWIMRHRIVNSLQDAGVTVVDPTTAYVGPDVAVGQDTVLHPGVYLYGETEIGEGCEIGPQAYLVDTVVEHDARIWFSVLEGAYVGEGARIGPYAHLRPGARIGARARIGNFVEVKNAQIGEDVRAGHLAYIGDAEVGPEANIGAGTITCNYDGVRKHKTVIGKGAFIGSNAALVAPVTIGEGAVVGAGSVITEDVPPHSLALGRARQVVKPEWARRKKEGEG